jgi:hypothetical protein
MGDEVFVYLGKTSSYQAAADHHLPKKIAIRRRILEEKMG